MSDYFEVEIVFIEGSSNIFKDVLETQVKNNLCTIMFEKKTMSFNVDRIFSIKVEEQK